MGFRLDPFDQHGIVDSVLRRVTDRPVAELFAAPKQGAGALPAIPAEIGEKTYRLRHSALSYNAVAQFATEYGMESGFQLARLGHDGCLARPEDVKAVLRSYEATIATLKDETRGLQNIRATMHGSGGDAADVLLHERGPAPQQFRPLRKNESGYSTSNRKRQIARGLYKLQSSALGGQKDFQLWMRDEMERAQGVSGLSSDFHIFDRDWLDELLESVRLKKELTRKLDKEQRPTRKTFAIKAKNIRQKDLNELRGLKPGFFPGTS